MIGVVYSQAAEIAVAANGKLWKCKPANHTPRKRSGVFDDLNRLVMGVA